VEQPSVIILGSPEAGGNLCLRCLESEGFRFIYVDSEEVSLDRAEWGLANLIVAVIPITKTEQPLAAAAKLRRSIPRIPLVIVVERGSEDLAIAALRLGVSDYFHMPQDEAQFRIALREIRDSAIGKDTPASINRSHDPFGSPFIGESAPILDLKARLSRIAATQINVLITGETGTGKELAATTIHRLSPRRNQPFTCINCAAIPDHLLESELFGYERGAFTGATTAKRGLLEETDGGTVFLDEIGDLQPGAQAKLLRAIENKEVRRLGAKTVTTVNLRFVGATHQDLESMIATKAFRADLYFRLNVIRVQIPPLRNRPADIPVLLQHYIRELNEREGRGIAGLSDEVWDCLMAYPWPGNIRELKNLIEAAYASSDGPRIQIEDLPEVFRTQARKSFGGEIRERDQLLSALLCTKWNKSKTAETLHWSRMTVYRKMAKYRIMKGR
jgi:DNA-binding NtrC family response regulator